MAGTLHTEDLLDAGIEALKAGRRELRLGSRTLTFDQGREALLERGYLLMDSAWRVHRNKAILAGELGWVLGNRIFFLSAGPHPWRHPSYCSLLCTITGGIGVVGDVTVFAQDLCARMPGLDFRDPLRWWRLQVAARNVGQDPSFPLGLCTDVRDRLSSAFLPQRRVRHARPDTGYFSPICLHRSLAEGLEDPALHPVAVAAASVSIAACQPRHDLSMGWFWGQVGAPVLASRTVEDLGPLRAVGCRLIKAAHRRRMQQRLKLLGPRIDRDFRDEAEFRSLVERVYAEPAVQQRLAEIEDETTLWLQQAFKDRLEAQPLAAYELESRVYVHLTRLLRGRITRRVLDDAPATWPAEAQWLP